MLNRSGISSATYTAQNQILANVEMQASVGCIVPQSLGVTVGTKKIVKAGTPVKIDMMNLQTVAVKGDAANAMNAVVLHDVDVTTGNANGTALYFGIVNVNRVESDVAAAITTALTATGISPLVVFAKM
jgi:hypothetical protein